MGCPVRGSCIIETVPKGDNHADNAYAKTDAAKTSRPADAKASRPANATTATADAEAHAASQADPAAPHASQADGSALQAEQAESDPARAKHAKAVARRPEADCSCVPFCSGTEALRIGTHSFRFDIHKYLTDCIYAT